MKLLISEKNDSDLTRPASGDGDIFLYFPPARRTIAYRHYDATLHRFFLNFPGMVFKSSYCISRDEKIKAVYNPYLFFVHKTNSITDRDAKWCIPPLPNINGRCSVCMGSVGFFDWFTLHCADNFQMYSKMMLERFWTSEFSYERLSNLPNSNFRDTESFYKISLDFLNEWSKNGRHNPNHYPEFSPINSTLDCVFNPYKKDNKFYKNNLHVNWTLHTDSDIVSGSFDELVNQL